MFSIDHGLIQSGFLVIHEGTNSLWEGGDVPLATLTIPLPSGYTSSQVACIIMGTYSVYTPALESMPESIRTWPVPVSIRGNIIRRNELFFCENYPGSWHREAEKYITAGKNKKGVLYFMFSCPIV